MRDKEVNNNRLSLLLALRQADRVLTELEKLQNYSVGNKFTSIYEVTEAVKRLKTTLQNNYDVFITNNNT